MSDQALSPQRLMEQERAKAAWACVKEMLHDPTKAAGYGRAARSAPADIQVNGLGQTLAFWKARAKKSSTAYYEDLLRHLSAWLHSRPGLNEGDLLDWVINTATTDQYRRATAEASAFLVWVKRFAEAEIGVDEGDSDGLSDPQK